MNITNLTFDNKILLDSAHWFLVPLAYLKILIFLKRQNKKVGAMTNSNNLGRRKKRNVISIAFNLLAWSLDLVGDILIQLTVRQNYILSMSLGLGFAAGVSPLVYMVGSGEFFAGDSKPQKQIENKAGKRVSI